MLQGRYTAFQLKLFMAFLMVFDHIPHLGSMIPMGWTLLFHPLTRVVSVWFAYSAVEGFLYTKNLKRYLLRLFAAAAVMFAGNQLLMALFADKGITIFNNIFLTLACGVLLLTCLTKIKSRPLAWLCAVAILALSVFTEGGLLILPFMMITYYTYGKSKPRTIAYLLLSLVLFLLSFQNYGDLLSTLQMLAYNSEFLFILLIPVLSLYNGQRGNHSTWSKYFFYVFYPAHLWILTILAYCLA